MSGHRPLKTNIFSGSFKATRGQIFSEKGQISVCFENRQSSYQNDALGENFQQKSLSRSCEFTQGQKFK